MSSAATIGALRVVLGADTAAFESGLKDAEGKLSDFGAKLGKGAAVVGAAVAAMAAAIGLGVAKTINLADDLHKLSQKIGIPVEELSRFKHAADLSGVSLETLSGSVAKMSKAMADIVAGGTGPAAQAFQSLGITVKNTDGTMKGSAQIIQEVASKFERMDDSATKTALAMAIFGRAGKDMIPLLNSGSKGLQEMMKEAEELGLVMDSKTTKSAETFNDNLTRLARVKDGIITQLTTKMLPTLEALSNWLVANAKASGIVQMASETLFQAFQGLTRGIIFVYDNLGTLIKVMMIFLAAQIAQVVVNMGIAFVKFASAISMATTATLALNAAKAMTTAKLVAFGGLILWATGNLETFNDKLFGLADTVRSVMDKVAPETTGAIEKGLKSLGLNTTALTKEFKDFLPVATQTDEQLKKLNVTLTNPAAQKAMQEFIASTAKSNAARMAELMTIGLQTGELERMRVILQGEALAKEKGIIMGERMRAKMIEQANAAGELALKLRGAQAIQELKPPHERYREELAKNEEAMRAAGATTEQVEAANKKIAERYAATWEQAAESIAGSFAQISGAFGKEGSAMAKAAKALGAVQAAISMYIGAAKALELPFPANIAAMAAVLAKGAAFVASIKSQSIPSFQTGGSFTIPGGIGGADRKMVPIMAHPGEQVDVWRPGEGGQDPRRGGGDRTITVEGLGPKQLFSGGQVRELIQMFNEALGDGARLRFA